MILSNTTASSSEVRCLLNFQKNAYFSFLFRLSNEQRISSPFGAKDFVPRLGIFSRNSTAIARKNNDALGQKISS